MNPKHPESNISQITFDTLEKFLCERHRVGDVEEIEGVHLLSPGRGPDLERSLLVVVHPGDLYEDDPAAIELQGDIGNEIDLLTAGESGVDVAVIHRLSSVLPGLSPNLTESIDDLTSSGYARTYWDDSSSNSLERIAQDLVAEYAAGDHPEVTFTGAFSDPEHGCITAIWKEMIRLGVNPDIIDVNPVSATATGLMETPKGTLPGPVLYSFDDEDTDILVEDGEPVPALD